MFLPFLDTRKCTRDKCTLLTIPQGPAGRSDDDDDGYDHDNESPAWPGLLGIQGYALLQVDKIRLHLPVSQ